jgi:GDP-mannose 4,6-dehydratase
VRVLVTGITGFVGSHLADFLAERGGVEIHGLARWRSPLDNLRGRLDDVTLHHGDLRDLGSLVAVLQACRPDAIFHLAARSYVPTSFTAPVDTLDVNVIGTTNLLEAIRISDLDPIVHVCSSSEVYGQVGPEDVPIREDCPLRPVSPYGVSKVGTDLVADVYHRAHGLRTIRSRMFTHSGPRRGDVFVDSWFALQLARIEAGRQEPVLRVGNLDSVRTFCDVRDTVRAYWALIGKGRVGEVYNIGGATTMTIAEMLELLLSFSKRGGSIEVRTDPTLLRPTDVTLQIPCTDKFATDTGWQPEIPYPRTLRDMLDYWRDRVERGSA